eukprot:TRINITY_DN110951_c0_g1_i1.p1 TRINITY_DN110951_c0_g1~~TRINITY_DN110951_c0_g1_i1.p1  ORF type:complete len:342 (-),score=46.08 TRINITY_DN110951_c0_g1_i1:27-1052(-)
MPCASFVMRAFLLALTFPACSDAAGSTVGAIHDTTHSHSGNISQLQQDCQQLTFAELMAKDHYWDGSVISYDTIWRDCGLVCPRHFVPDFRGECTHGKHAHHSAYSTWSANVTHHAGLQWKMGFLILAILTGALCRACNPTWMPYTVSLLIVFFILGIIAGATSQAMDCPSSAYFLAGADGKVDKTEWDGFIGVGWNKDSFCSSLSCGDGQVNPTGCRWKFDDLDKEFKLSLMLAESVDDGAGDHYLTADELWTFECNFLRDLLSLADLDPHVLLVVFLPPLLFESACFGIDMGIFNQQLFQIGIMAFPGMIVSSVLTGLLLWAALQDWTLWVCWLIGVIY